MKYEINNIYNTDSIPALLEEPKDIDLLLTDPPYNISSKTDAYTYDKRARGKTKKADRIMNFGTWDHGFDINWLEKILPQCKGWVILFCAQQQVSDYMRMLYNDDFTAVGMGVWDKKSGLFLNAKVKFVNVVEVFVYAKRPKATWNSVFAKNLYRMATPTNKMHPTQKPLPIFRDLIKLTTNPGDLVVDPFAGSGTTAVASLELSRNYLVFEKDPTHFQTAKERIETHTLQEHFVEVGKLA